MKKQMILGIVVLVIWFPCFLLSQVIQSISRTATTQVPIPFPKADRICCSGSDWNKIETSRGVYVWTGIDGYVTSDGSHSGSFPILSDRYIPIWASGAVNLSSPPNDLSVNAACQGTMTGTTTTNCKYKEYVTALMRHVCGVTTAPPNPLTGTCTVKTFEAWNEWNVGNYWTGTYTQLARMLEDKAAIIRLYCGDCTIIGGSVSAGGDGSGGSWITALETVLAAWTALTPHHLPNVISWHAYPARTNVSPVPFPETVASHSDVKCTGAVNVYCRTAVKDQVAMLYSTAILSNPAIASWAANLPVWQTEGGYGVNTSLTDGISDTSANTKFLRAAYASRWMIALTTPPAHGTAPAQNLWYVWQDQCWGTQLGTGVSSGCGSIIPSGVTSVNSAFAQTKSWLDGASVIGSMASTPVTGGNIWTVNLTTAGFPQQLAWFDGWLATTSFSTTYTSQQDLTGTVTPVSAGSTTLGNQPILLSAPAPPSYIISTSITGSGTVADCAGSHVGGSAYSCSVTPASGFTTSTTTGCAGSLAGTTYNGTMPASDCTVSVTFLATPPPPASTGITITVGVTITKDGVKIQ